MSKKLSLGELKVLVFEKDKATNNQKTKLFKLAKANNDMETIERLRDVCDFKSAKTYLDKLHNLSTEDIIKNRDGGNLKKITENEFDESKMGIEDLFPLQYEIPKEHYKDDSSVVDNMKIIITSPLDTTPELKTAEGAHYYQSRLSKLTHSELSIELSNVMAAKHNLMSVPTRLGEAKETEEKITDLTDKSLAICIQNFGNDMIISYGDGDISRFVDLVNTIDAEVAQEVLNAEKHGSKMLDKIKIALSENSEGMNTTAEQDIGTIERLRDEFEFKNKIDINSKDDNGLTPLMKLVISKKIAMIEDFITLHPDVNIQDNNNQDIVKLLLNLNPNINLQNNYAQTALHYAVIESNIDIIKILINIDNINLNIQNQDGNTVLMFAAYSNNIDIIKLLLNDSRIDFILILEYSYCV